MTLNDHFALKYVLGLAFNGLEFWLSVKTVRKYAELRIYCRPQKCIPGTVLLIQMYRIIHWGSPKRKRQTIELYSHSQFSHMLFTDVCR